MPPLDKELLALAREVANLKFIDLNCFESR
jgi:hypothetical protein